MYICDEGRSRDRWCSNIVSLALFVKALNLIESLTEVTLHSIERILLLVGHAVAAYVRLVLVVLALQLFPTVTLFKHVDPILHQDQLSVDLIELCVDLILIGVESGAERPHTLVQCQK